jgi:hypothetical protein
VKIAVQPAQDETTDHFHAYQAQNCRGQHVLPQVTEVNHPQSMDAAGDDLC